MEPEVITDECPEPEVLGVARNRRAIWLVKSLLVGHAVVVFLDVASWLTPSPVP